MDNRIWTRRRWRGMWTQPAAATSSSMRSCSGTRRRRCVLANWRRRVDYHARRSSLLLLLLHALTLALVLLPLIVGLDARSHLRASADETAAADFRYTYVATINKFASSPVLPNPQSITSTSLLTLPIGFDFPFFGRTYTSVIVTPLGALHFQPPPLSRDFFLERSFLPSPRDPDGWNYFPSPFIAFAFQRSTARLQRESITIEHNTFSGVRGRAFVFRFTQPLLICPDGASYLSDSTLSLNLDFALYEDDGRIELHYTVVTLANSLSTIPFGIAVGGHLHDDNTREYAVLPLVANFTLDSSSAAQLSSATVTWHIAPKQPYTSRDINSTHQLPVSSRGAYRVRQPSTFSLPDMTGARVWTLAPSALSLQLPLGFPFSVYGTWYSTVWMHFSGALWWNDNPLADQSATSSFSLDAFVAAQPQPVPFLSPLVRAPLPATSITFNTVLRNAVQPGSRSFVVRFTNLPIAFGTCMCSNVTASYDVVIDEATMQLTVQFYSFSRLCAMPLSIVYQASGDASLADTDGLARASNYSYAVFDAFLTRRLVEALVGSAIVFEPLSAPSRSDLFTPSYSMHLVLTPSLPSSSLQLPPHALPLTHTLDVRGDLSGGQCRTLRLGFPVWFYDRYQRNVVVAAHGAMMFSVTSRSAIAYAPLQLPALPSDSLMRYAPSLSSAYPIPDARFTRSILFFYTRLLPIELNSLSYARSGVYPMRTLAIRLHCVPHASAERTLPSDFYARMWGRASSAANTTTYPCATLDVVLYEQDSRIEVRYHRVDVNPLQTVTIGIQGGGVPSPTGELPHTVLANNVTIDSALATRLVNQTLVILPITSTMAIPSMPSPPTLFRPYNISFKPLPPEITSPTPLPSNAIRLPTTSAWIRDIPLGFSFTFFGIAYDRVAIVSQRALAFGVNVFDSATLSKAAGLPMPSTAPSAQLFRFAPDITTLFDAPAAMLRYVTIRASDLATRIWLLRFEGMKFSSNPVTLCDSTNEFPACPIIDLDVLLYEGTNRLEVRFYRVARNAFSTTSNTIIGVESVDAFGESAWVALMNGPPPIEFIMQLNSSSVLFDPVPLNLASQLGVNGSSVATPQTQPVDLASLLDIAWSSSTSRYNLSRPEVMSSASFVSGKTLAVGFPLQLAETVFTTVLVDRRGLSLTNGANSLLVVALSPLQLAQLAYGSFGPYRNRTMLVRFSCASFTVLSSFAPFVNTSNDATCFEFDVLFFESDSRIEIRVYQIGSALAASSGAVTFSPRLTLGYSRSVSRDDWSVDRLFLADGLLFVRSVLDLLVNSTVTFTPRCSSEAPFIFCQPVSCVTSSMYACTHDRANGPWIDDEDSAVHANATASSAALPIPLPCLNAPESSCTSQARSLAYYFASPITLPISFRVFGQLVTDICISGSVIAFSSDPVSTTDRRFNSLSDIRGRYLAFAVSQHIGFASTFWTWLEDDVSTGRSMHIRITNDWRVVTAVTSVIYLRDVEVVLHERDDSIDVRYRRCPFALTTITLAIAGMSTVSSATVLNSADADVTMHLRLYESTLRFAPLNSNRYFVPPSYDVIVRGDATWVDNVIASVSSRGQWLDVSLVDMWARPMIASIGFPFLLFGQWFDVVTLSPRGYLQFSQYHDENLETLSLPVNASLRAPLLTFFMAPTRVPLVMCDGRDGGLAAPRVRIGQVGSYPQRVWVMQMDRVVLSGSSSSSSPSPIVSCPNATNSNYYSVDVILREDDYSMNVRYRDVGVQSLSSTSSSSPRVSIGLQDTFDLLRPFSADYVTLANQSSVSLVAAAAQLSYAVLTFAARNETRPRWNRDAALLDRENRTRTVQPAPYYDVQSVTSVNDSFGAHLSPSTSFSSSTLNLTTIWSGASCNVSLASSDMTGIGTIPLATRVDLGFKFTFFGNTFTRVWLLPGQLRFDSPATTIGVPSSSTLPSSGCLRTPLLAFFYSDALPLPGLLYNSWWYARGVGTPPASAGDGAVVADQFFAVIARNITFDPLIDVPALDMDVVLWRTSGVIELRFHRVLPLASNTVLIGVEGDVSNARNAAWSAVNSTVSDSAIAPVCDAITYWNAQPLLAPTAARLSGTTVLLKPASVLQSRAVELTRNAVLSTTSQSASAASSSSATAQVGRTLSSYMLNVTRSTDAVARLRSRPPLTSSSGAPSPVLFQIAQCGTPWFARNNCSSALLGNLSVVTPDNRSAWCRTRDTDPAQVWMATPSDSYADALILPLSFSFTMFGMPWSYVRVSLHGYLEFGGSSDRSSPLSFPFSKKADYSTFPFVAFFAQQLPYDQVACVTYGTIGVAPQRTFVLRFERLMWTDVAVVGAGIAACDAIRSRGRDPNATSADSSAQQRRDGDPVVSLDVLLREADGSVRIEWYTAHEDAWAEANALAAASGDSMTVATMGVQSNQQWDWLLADVLFDEISERVVASSRARLLAQSTYTFLPMPPGVGLGRTITSSATVVDATDVFASYVREPIVCVAVGRLRCTHELSVAPRVLGRNIPVSSNYTGPFGMIYKALSSISLSYPYIIAFLNVSGSSSNTVGALQPLQVSGVLVNFEAPDTTCDSSSRYQMIGDAPHRTFVYGLTTSCKTFSSFDADFIWFEDSPRVEIRFYSVPSTTMPSAVVLRDARSLDDYVSLVESQVISAETANQLSMSTLVIEHVDEPALSHDLGCPTVPRWRTNNSLPWFSQPVVVELTLVLSLARTNVVRRLGDDASAEFIQQFLLSAFTLPESSSVQAECVQIVDRYLAHVLGDPLNSDAGLEVHLVLWLADSSATTMQSSAAALLLHATSSTILTQLRNASNPLYNSSNVFNYFGAQGNQAVQRSDWWVKPQVSSSVVYCRQDRSSNTTTMATTMATTTTTSTLYSFEPSVCSTSGVCTCGAAGGGNDPPPVSGSTAGDGSVSDTSAVGTALIVVALVSSLGVVIVALLLAIYCRARCGARGSSAHVEADDDVADPAKRAIEIEIERLGQPAQSAPAAAVASSASSPVDERKSTHESKASQNEWRSEQATSSLRPSATSSPPVASWMARTLTAISNSPLVAGTTRAPWSSSSAGVRRLRQQQQQPAAPGVGDPIAALAEERRRQIEEWSVPSATFDIELEERNFG